MAMRKIWDPAHTEYFLVRGEDEYFNGRSYRSALEAQRDADSMNARRDAAKYGRVEVRSKEREGQYAYQTTLRL